MRILSMDIVIMFQMTYNSTAGLSVGARNGCNKWERYALLAELTPRSRVFLEKPTAR
jgi:hypothetical protein